MDDAKDLIKAEAHAPAIRFDREKIELIKRTVAKDASDDELQLFLHQAQRTGLDPLSRQIYFRKQRTKNGDQVTIITGIDGYRLIADRTGKYVGNDDPVFDDEININKATVTVWKLVGGIRCPFTATARWSQYYPGDAPGFMWRKMPHLMLGKCAEALALRKAFPAELSGIYTTEEMEQAGFAPSQDSDGKTDGKTDGKKTTPPRTTSQPEIYTGTPEQQARLVPVLEAERIDESLWGKIGDLLSGKPATVAAVKEAAKRAIAEL